MPAIDALAYAFGCTGIRIRNDLLRFGLLYSHGRSLSRTNLLSGGGRHSQVLGPGARPFAAAPRGRSFPPEDRPHPVRLMDLGVASDGHRGALDRGSPNR